ncbi:MAG TPA: lytic transglycosylase, partial [Geobacteraceae bacterium]|nr:lytic transglycosylase [Geobacteraceae bacterium]
MRYRFTPYLIIVLLCCISVSRASSLLPPKDESLLLAAEQLREEDYAAARVAALQAQPGATKDFVLGVTAYHLGKWGEAENYLANVSDSFPLLGDVALSYRATALVKLSRPAEALVVAERLRKEYPDSP